MYDHDLEKLFAMLIRVEWPGDGASIAALRQTMNAIGQRTGLAVRTWSRDEHARRPRLAICTTYRSEPPLAILRDIRDGRLKAEAACIIGNRKSCQGLAEQFGVPFENIGDAAGNPDNDRLVTLLDEYDIDHLVLARYMSSAGSRSLGVRRA
ncbi:MAG: hypothetical protein R3B90_12145 [Planctomycetaceae bacterium]